MAGGLRDRHGLAVAGQLAVRARRVPPRTVTCRDIVDHSHGNRDEQARFATRKDRVELNGECEREGRRERREKYAAATGVTRVGRQLRKLYSSF